MNCKYSFKDEKSKYLNCSLTGRGCPLVRFCGSLDEIISIDNHAEMCKEYKNEEDRKAQKNGSNRVRFEKDGMLFVELNDEKNQVRKFENPYNYTPAYVSLVVVDGEYYLSGQQPKKRTNRTKK